MKLNTMMVECVHQRSKELLLGSANTDVVIIRQSENPTG